MSGSGLLPERFDQDETGADPDRVPGLSSQSELGSARARFIDQQDEMLRMRTGCP